MLLVQAQLGLHPALVWMRKLAHNLLGTQQTFLAWSELVRDGGGGHLLHLTPGQHYRARTPGLGEAGL